MNFKYPVKINLGIVAYGKGDFSTYNILTIDGSPPFVYLSGAKDIVEVVEKLFSEYVDLTIDWQHTKLVSVKNIGKNGAAPELNLNYVYLIPSSATLKKGNWKTFIEVYHNRDNQYENYKEIITKIGEVFY